MSSCYGESSTMPRPSYKKLAPGAVQRVDMTYFPATDTAEIHVHLDPNGDDPPILLANLDPLPLSEAHKIVRAIDGIRSAVRGGKYDRRSIEHLLGPDGRVGP